MRRVFLAASAAFGLSMGAASAAVIGFDAFNNSRQPDFFQHSEDGFTVRVRQGDWREAFYFGTSAPSIFSRSDRGRIVVRADDRSDFRAASVNIGNGSLFSGHVSYLVRGSLNGTTIFNTRGDVTDLNAFNKILLDDSQVIDRLVIRLDKKGAASFNVDDIALTSASGTPWVVPLPASLPLLMAGAALLLGLRRRS